jgi:L-ascorbate metabolism protein UlaG (beta-lactamase superfamily)
MSNIREINPNRITPEMVAAETLSIAEDLECLVVIKVQKDGIIDFDNSDCSPAMLAHLALALQAELVDRMRE